MEYSEIRSKHGDTYDQTLPLPVDTVEAQETVSVSPTLTYNGKAAAGSISIASCAFKPIIENLGSRTASYWGRPENLVYSALSDAQKGKDDISWLLSVTETATAAAITIYDPSKNLEEMFESVTGTVKRFVVKVYDTSGGILYGWVRGISVSSNVYTFEIMNNRLTETQSWVGNLSAFDNTALKKVEIYFYNSSVAFGTGTTFTEEVECPKEYSKNRELQLKFAETLSNGQYFIDYWRAEFIGVKADTTASETVTYNIWSSTSGGSSGGPSSNVAVTSVIPGTGATNLGKSEDSTHNSGDVGVMALAVSNEGQNNFSSTDNDYTPIAVSRKGNIYVEGNTDHGSTDSGYPVKVGGKYNAVAPSLSANQRGDLQLDSSANLKISEQFAPGAEDNTEGLFAITNKPTSTSTYTWSSDSSSALEASSVSKASTGNLRQFFGFIDASAATDIYYVQILNHASLPADGPVTHLCAPVVVNHTTGTDTKFELPQLPLQGLNASTGITWCVSTTAVTKTIAGSIAFATLLYK